MGSARIASLDSSSEEVFDIVEDQGCVVDCVDLDSEELLAHGPGQTLAQVVNIELNVHRMSLLRMLYAVVQTVR